MAPSSTPLNDRVDGAGSPIKGDGGDATGVGDVDAATMTVLVVAFLALVVVLGLFLFLVGRFLEVRKDWRLDEEVLNEEALDEEALYEEALDDVLDRRWRKKKDCQQQPQHPDPTRPDPTHCTSDPL
jgi:hypothetical protein